MPFFVVVRERGEGWDWSRPMRGQVEWDEHAAFMDGLADERFILAGGPLGDEDAARRVLFVVAAEDVAAVAARLERDPWHPLRLLRTVSIEPWTILVGKL